MLFIIIQNNVNFKVRGVFTCRKSLLLWVNRGHILIVLFYNGKSINKTTNQYER